jgi:poly-gamma-glutamate synthase PgsB/CapB
MTAMGVVGICLGLLVGLGAVERWRRDRARAGIPIRIHVNGTRGKSTVTRLIAGALREAGIPTIAKTTGAFARVILEDGSERPVLRRAPANIHEQLWFLRFASRHGARAVVVECMAIDPALQWTSEHDMVGATIGVITNARSDHADLMGATREDVAQALASTIPRHGILMTGDIGVSAPIAQRAAALGTRVIEAAREWLPPSASHVPPWIQENMRIALAVTRHLGIAESIALRGMLAAAPDPGAARSGSLSLDGVTIRYVDATSANDPESLQALLESEASGHSPARVFVFNHRIDRPLRLAQFAASTVWSRPADRIVVTGDRPDAFSWRRLARRINADRVEFVPRAGLRRALPAFAGQGFVVFCGNSKGFSLDGLSRGDTNHG